MRSRSLKIFFSIKQPPQGTAHFMCLCIRFRFNYNGVDLNRNFPDAFAGLRRQKKLDEEKREAEVGWQSIKIKGSSAERA